MSVGQTTQAIEEINPIFRHIYNLEQYNNFIFRGSITPPYATDHRIRFLIGGRWGLFFQLAGRDLNGTGLNGYALDGHFVSAISLDSATLSDVSLKKLVLIGTVLKGLKRHGGPVWGRGLIGMTFVGELEDSGTVPLRIDAVRWNTEPGQTDLMLYDVSYENESGWTPLCGLDSAGKAIPAIPLAGRWNYGVGTVGSGSWVDDKGKFTFACQGFILEKCVVAGYRPWIKFLDCTKKHHGKGRACTIGSLAPYHQACTRLLRADFCGDGTPFTIDGTEVNMYDGLGIRLDTEDWLAEAEWDANGARCANLERIAGYVPPCLSSLATAECGNPAHFASGTLLISEVALSE